MADRKTVIYAIERCTCHVPDACRDCAYDAGHPYNECVEMLLNDALELLKNDGRKRESRSMLPCKCGGKRREHWFSPDSEVPEILKCKKCGLWVSGKNATDVIRRWNKVMKNHG